VKWYEDKELLQLAYQEHGSLTLVAERIGGASPSTLRNWWRIHGLEPLPRGPQPTARVNIEALSRLYAKVSS
jgi:transposase-like protein